MFVMKEIDFKMNGYIKELLLCQFHFGLPSQSNSNVRGNIIKFLL